MPLSVWHGRSFSDLLQSWINARCLKDNLTHNSLRALSVPVQSFMVRLCFFLKARLRGILVPSFDAILGSYTHMKALTRRKDEDALALELGCPSLLDSRAPECCVVMAPREGWVISLFARICL